jgi:hypothetical protein
LCRRATTPGVCEAESTRRIELTHQERLAAALVELLMDEVERVIDAGQDAELTASSVVARVLDQRAALGAPPLIGGVEFLRWLAAEALRLRYAPWLPETE